MFNLLFLMQKFSLYYLKMTPVMTIILATEKTVFTKLLKHYYIETYTRNAVI